MFSKLFLSIGLTFLLSACAVRNGEQIHGVVIKTEVQATGDEAIVLRAYTGNKAYLNGYFAGKNAHCQEYELDQWFRGQPTVWFTGGSPYDIDNQIRLYDLCDDRTYGWVRDMLDNRVTAYEY